jgi:hypothetical protein
VASCPEMAAQGEVRLLAALAKALLFLGLRGFEVSGKVFLAEGLGDLSTFGDSLLGARFFACESEWMS